MRMYLSLLVIFYISSIFNLSVINLELVKKHHKLSQNRLPKSRKVFNTD